MIYKYIFLLNDKEYRIFFFKKKKKQLPMPGHFCPGLKFDGLLCNMKLHHCHGTPGHLQLTLQDLVLTPAYITYFKTSRWSEET